MMFRILILSMLFTACIAQLDDYYCPSSSWILGYYPDGVYCHITIPRYEVSTGEATYVQADNWCNSQVGGRLASIHSEAENNAYLGWVGFGLSKKYSYFLALQNEKTTKLKGAAIGLIAEDGNSDTASSTRWLDGTPVTYNNINVGTATTFNVTLMGNTGQWNTKVPIYNIQLAFKYIHCKVDALY